MMTAPIHTRQGGSATRPCKLRPLFVLPVDNISLGKPPQTNRAIVAGGCNQGLIAAHDD